MGTDESLGSFYMDAYTRFIFTSHVIFLVF